MWSKDNALNPCFLQGLNLEDCLVLVLKFCVFFFFFFFFLKLPGLEERLRSILKLFHRNKMMGS